MESLNSDFEGERKSVMLVEDSVETQLIIRAAIGSQLHLICVESASAAVEKLKVSNVDLLLLDLQLPGLDGLTFCSQLKSDEKTKDIPIFVITGRGDTPTKVKGFSLGIEDYILKPFDPLELRARVLAKLKKVKERASLGEVFYVDDLCINAVTHRVYRIDDGEKRDLGLTPAEFKLFSFFLRNLGKTFDREQILSTIWGSDFGITDRVIDRHISTLRKKLGAFGKKIQTLAGQGYGLSVTSVQTQSSKLG